MSHALRRQIRNVSFAYPAALKGDVPKPVLTSVVLDVPRDARIGIIGLNGVGKSSLLSLLCGKLYPSSGEVFCHHNIRIAMFSQYQVDQLNLGITAVEHMRSKYPSMSEHDARKALGAFDLKGNIPLQKISSLSGGQRSRCLLAELAWANPHILLLDEITNHLDLESIEAMIEALKGFKGGIVFVSHDQYFVKSVATQLYMVKDCKVRLYEGSIEDFMMEEIVDGDY